MNEEVILKEGLVKKPFEARLADEDLKARVQYFQKLLNLKHKNKTVKRIGRINA